MAAGGDPFAPLDATTALTAWNVEPALGVALCLTAFVYVRGWRRLRRRRPERAPAWHLASFLSGLGSLFVALASPLDTFADRRLAVHMAQHMVLLVVTPPLLLLGAPVAPLLHGLPAGRMRATLGAAMTWLGDRLAHPVLCWVAMSLVLWGWHVPAAFELALRSPPWHVVEHASFLAAGLLFWWPVVQPWPSRTRWPRWTMIPYLLLADVQNTALAALLTFSDRLLYPSYAGGPSPLDDQMAAGLLMWVPMSVAYLVPACVLTARLLTSRSLALRPSGRPAPSLAPP